MGPVSQNVSPSRLRIALAILALLAALFALSRPAAKPPGVPQMLSTAEAMIQSALANPEFVIGDQHVDGAALMKFYQSRNQQLVWSNGIIANANAEIVLRALRHAEDHGLDSSGYHIAQLTYPMAFVDREGAAAYDLLLTDAIFRYARDLSQGQRISSAERQKMSLQAEALDPVTALQAALASGTLTKFLQDLAPPYAEYARLVDGLAQYNASAAAGDAFAADRVRQIKANMERWRWMPRQLENRYVMVNAADATLQLMDDGEVVLNSKVIVGKATTPTPIFRAVVREVTANPPWNVPETIARKEILPKLRRNPGYLASQHMILLGGPADDPQGRRIDWKKVSSAAFPYRLQQLPGPDNALGVLKLEMPNGFDVYLHDTPSKSLFARPVRTFSHGCVRVEQIAPLAMAALSSEPTAALARINAAIASGETKRLAAPNPLPVYVVYWTVFAGPNGALQFRPDIYGRDATVDLSQDGKLPKG